ncbi:MAG: hypothetical protein ABIB79_03135 [archaeon]
MYKLKLDDLPLEEIEKKWNRQYITGRDKRDLVLELLSSAGVARKDILSKNSTGLC